MSWIHKITLQYPVTESEIRAAYPLTGFPTPFTAPDEYALVFPVPQPEHDTLTHYVVAGAPELTAKGTYEQKWQVIERDEPLEPEPEPVPAACTRRQGLRALISYGFMPSQIEDLIAAIPNEVQRELTRVDYEAATWERADESLQAMWAQLGGTPDQLDDLFRLAVTL